MVDQAMLIAILVYGDRRHSTFICRAKLLRKGLGF